MTFTGEVLSKSITKALDVSFMHIDDAEMYRNEKCANIQMHGLTCPSSGGIMTCFVLLIAPRGTAGGACRRHVKAGLQAWFDKPGKATCIHFDVSPIDTRIQATTDRSCSSQARCSMSTDQVSLSIVVRGRVARTACMDRRSEESVL